MGAVANITELSNSNTIGNALSAIGSPALVKGVLGLNLMYTENLPEKTNVKKFMKFGSLTAASLAESTALQPDANGELTDSSVSATAAKIAVSSGLSVEEEKFGMIDLARIANEQFSAIARAVDNDFIGMAAGLATTQTAASVMTIDDIMIGQLSIYNSNVPNQEVTLAAVLGPRAVYNVKKEIIQSGAAAWSNPAQLNIFQGAPVKANGFVGNIPGVCDVYQTTGFATTGGDDQQMIIHPQWCLAGMFDSAPVSWVERKGPEGLYTSVISYLFYDVIEWNDLAGVMLRSDT